MRWIIFDVDGVLSPYTRQPDPSWQPWTQPGNTKFSVLLSRSMGDAITELIDKHNLHGAWLSTWCRDGLAHDVIAPTVGFGHDWPLIQWEDHQPMLPAWGGTPDRPHSAKAWGLGAWIESLDEEPEAVVWLDDELRAAHDLDFDKWERWGGPRNPLVERDIPHLLIGPKAMVGLTREQLQSIDRWLTELLHPD